MQLMGKLHPDGTLTDLMLRDPLTYGDGSIDVLLVSAPTFDGPYGYDAVNQVATFNSAAVTAQAQAAALAAIIAAFGMQVPMEIVGDVVTTLATPVAINDVGGKGLNFPIGANENWHMEFELFCLGSAAGMKVCLAGPANPVSVKLSAFGNSTAVTAVTRSFSQAFGTLTPLPFIVNSTPFTGGISVAAHVANGPNPGIVQLQFASTTAAQSNRINARSFGRAWRAAV
jgi:hypothetical protein